MRDPGRSLHYELCRFISRLAFTLLNTGCTVRGAEHLPPAGEPYVLALNHASVLDPMLVWAFFPQPIRFIGKDSIHQVPVVGTCSKLLGNIGIRRGAFDRAAIRHAVRSLTVKKRSLGVFVEGTRTPDGEIHPAKKGPALLVLMTGVPVVPAYIGGTYEAWSRHNWLPGWCPRLSITAGPTLRYPRFDGAPPKERLEEVASDITQALRDLRAQGAKG